MNDNKRLHVPYFGTSGGKKRRNTKETGFKSCVVSASREIMSRRRKLLWGFWRSFGGCAPEWRDARERERNRISRAHEVIPTEPSRTRIQSAQISAWSITSFNSFPFQIYNAPERRVKQAWNDNPEGRGGKVQGFRILHCDAVICLL